MGWSDCSPACDRTAVFSGDPIQDFRYLAHLVPAAVDVAAPIGPPPRDPEAARTTLRALGWVFPEVDPDGAVLRRERRVRCDVGDAARGPVEQAVVAAVRAGRPEGGW